LARTSAGTEKGRAKEYQMKHKEIPDSPLGTEEEQTQPPDSKVDGAPYRSAFK
jgi:hypothetical protein